MEGLRTSTDRGVSSTLNWDIVLFELIECYAATLRYLLFSLNHSLMATGCCTPV